MKKKKKKVKKTNLCLIYRQNGNTSMIVGNLWMNEHNVKILIVKGGRIDRIR